MNGQTTGLRPPRSSISRLTKTSLTSLSKFRATLSSTSEQPPSTVTSSIPTSTAAQNKRNEWKSKLASTKQPLQSVQHHNAQSHGNGRQNRTRMQRGKPGQNAGSQNKQRDTGVSGFEARDTARASKTRRRDHAGKENPATRRKGAAESSSSNKRSLKK